MCTNNLGDTGVKRERELLERGVQGEKKCLFYVSKHYIMTKKKSILSAYLSVKIKFLN